MEGTQRLYYSWICVCYCITILFSCFMDLKVEIQRGMNNLIATVFERENDISVSINNN